MHSVLSCLVSDIIGPATVSEELISAVRIEYGFEGGVALREYTRAVELVCEALALSKGDKVMLSPLAPRVYCRVLESLGIHGVLVDVREDDASFDTDLLIRNLSPEIKAIFIHASMGQVPDMENLYDLGIPLVVDLGEALGAYETDAYLGYRAQYIILPMEPEGIATAGGGTLILARSRNDAAKLREIMSQFSEDSLLSDINASLGLIQWKNYPKALKTRKNIHDAYVKSLAKGRHRTLLNPSSENTMSIAYSFPVVLSSGLSEVRHYARERGVETLPAFAGRAFDSYPEDKDFYPRAQSLVMSTLLFPLYPTLSKKNIQLIMKVLSTLP